MTPKQFRIAGLSLSAGFAVLMLLACLPTPSPSTAWKIAQEIRYLERFPELRPKDGLENSSRTKLARDEHPDLEWEADEKTPVRTAAEPGRRRR